MVSSDPARSVAPTTNGAAAEKSPGTVTSSSARRAAGSIETERGRCRTPAPAARSISSVWSRVGAGSETVLVPSAFRAASRIADFTWALATGSASSPSAYALTPSARAAAIVDAVSAERPNPRTRVSPSQSAPIRTARCEIDLSPGTAMCPTSTPAGSTLVTLASHPRHGVRHRDVAERGSFAEDGRRDHVVALRLEDGGRARGFVFVSDEEGERSAALAGHVLQLEVLDVDPLRAERLRDAG